MVVGAVEDGCRYGVVTLECQGFGDLGWVMGGSSVAYGLESPVFQLGTQTLTSLGAVSAKALVVTEVVGDGCGCWDIASRSLGLSWLWLKHRM